MEQLQDDDPRQIGKYAMLGRLGSGGMGEVFLGRSLGGRLVAVKVIHQALARDREFRARFAREVAAARLVSGVFTAPVIDADPQAELPWLATGYVNGPSLAQVVEEHGPLPVPAVLALAAGLAEGLGAVHEAGVTHRDLKPSNVLLAADGPRLIDFGISHAADFSSVTLAGTVVGTPGFMSPEQALGDRVGQPSDIFSLGAVLAFAATGEGPYGSGSPAAQQIRVANFAPRLDNLPAELRPLVERCMTREPGDRPTAGQFLADLVAAHPGAAGDWLPASILETRAVPPGLAPTVAPALVQPGLSGPRRAPWRRRQTWIAVVVALVAAGTAAGVVVALPSAPAVAAPTGLAARDLMPESVELAWSGPASGSRPDGYQVLENGRPVASVPGRETDYSATGLTPGTAYQFSVVAVSGSGRSAASGSLTVTTTNPPPARPAGFTAADRTPGSVELTWSGPAADGVMPDHYEVLRNGTEVASVPGGTTNYKVAGLKAATTYQFSVIAVRDGRKSPASTLTAATVALSLSDAVLRWSGQVGVTDVVGNFNYELGGTTVDRSPGDSWLESWTFTPDCTSGLCGVKFHADTTGNVVTVPLARNGATFSGSAAEPHGWYCGTNKSDYMPSTVYVTVKATGAAVTDGTWTVKSFTATIIWDAQADAAGECSPISDEMEGSTG